MSVTIGDQEYLNQEEAIEYLNKKGIHFSSPITFRSLRDQYSVKGVHITGKGRALFYKPQDLDAIPIMAVEE